MLWDLLQCLESCQKVFSSVSVFVYLHLLCNFKLQLCGWPQEILISSVALLLPFPLLTSFPSLGSTIEIPGSHYQLRGLRVNPIFQLSSPFSPHVDSFPGVTGSCHLNSHQFTRGKGVVSIGNPPSPLPHVLLLFPCPHTLFSVLLIDRSLISGITRTKMWTWLKTCLKHWWILSVTVLMCFCQILLSRGSSYRLPAQKTFHWILLNKKKEKQKLRQRSECHVYHLYKQFACD